MHRWRYLMCWFGFLVLTPWMIALLAADAQVRQTTVDLPANATLDYTGRAWECKQGYRRDGNECVVVHLPANATLDYTGRAWVCKRGYRRDGNECVAVHLPANATLDYRGHGWECKRGYSRQDNACAVVHIPEHATLDYDGHGWECKRGYHRHGIACAVVHIPEHATLDYSGHRWECKRSYRRVGDACEKRPALSETSMSSAIQESSVSIEPQSNFKEEIRQIQEQLKKAGVDPGPVDGILGRQTIQALHRYLVTK